jgi:hypothetical protein
MNAPLVLYVGKDLMLSGPIRQAAQSSGWTYAQSEDPSNLPGDPDPLVVVADLGALKEKAETLGEAARRRSGKTVLAGIAFHTDTESHERAVRARFDRVIHRSRLGPDLKDLLNAVLSGR